MSKFTFTLNRLHKIIERAVKLREETFTDLLALASQRGELQALGATTESVEREIAKSVTTTGEIAAGFIKIDKLNALIGDLKTCLIRTNVTQGVNQKIAHLDNLNKTLLVTQKLFSAVTNTGYLHRSDTQIDNLKQEFEGFTNVRDMILRSEDGAKVLTEKRFQYLYAGSNVVRLLEGELKSLRVQIDQVNDQIAELNSARVEVEIDNTIAARLGLVVPPVA